MVYHYEKAIELVLSAKKYIDEYKNCSYEMKGENDFVTIADTSISEYLKNELKVAYPDVDFFSEEEDGELQGNCWILDPIDGTTNFIRGYNVSSISLAHFVEDRIVFGVVYNPFSGEVFEAKMGEGAYVSYISDLSNKRKLSVSHREIKESIIEFGAGSTKKHFAKENFTIAYNMFVEIGDIRRMCSTAFALAQIADGRIEGYFEKVIKPWDIAAGGLMVEEAGGKITDYQGNPIDYSNKNTTVIVSNSKIHNFLVSKINEVVG